MKPLKLFLSGSMKKTAYRVQNRDSWNSELEDILTNSLKFPIEISNPIRITVDECESQNRFTADLRMLLESDAMILEASEKRGIGVGAELILAKSYKIPVYSIVPEDSHYRQQISGLRNWIHPFINELSDKVFESISSLADYLNLLNNEARLPQNPGIDAMDVINRIISFDGGYDEGYTSVKQFWGAKPAELVVYCVELLKPDYNRNGIIQCLDLGCGHGKNAIYLRNQGYSVDAIDSSYYCIREAKTQDSEINWINQDIRKVTPPIGKYDLVVMTGCLHCLATKEEVYGVIKAMKDATKVGGYHVLSSFNSKEQDMSGHSITFHPILLAHEEYKSLYLDWDIITETSNVQEDLHPHNGILHRHSITRILARKK